MVTITINGVNWTSKINDLALQVKDVKQSYTNIKGGGITIPPRSQVSGKSIKVTMSYLSRADYLTVKALYDSTNTVAMVFTGLDLPSGTYVMVEFTMQLVKALDQVLYNVIFIIQQDTPAQVPAPPTPAKPLTSGALTTKLGL